MGVHNNLHILTVPNVKWSNHRNSFNVMCYFTSNKSLTGTTSYVSIMFQTVTMMMMMTHYTFITIRNEVAKVMFLQMCVCPQGGIPACLAGGIPACLAAGLQVEGCAIPACIAGDIPACFATGLQGRSAPGGSALGVCSRGVPALGGVEIPQKQMTTVVDGMHPTGMHSCSGIKWVKH